MTTELRYDLRGRFRADARKCVRSALHWAILALTSLIFVAGLELLRLPAALLLGSLVAAALIAAADVRLHVPALLFRVAQAVVGCMIARAFPVATVSEIARGWPVFLGGVLSVIAVSAALGWLLARWQVLPGTTAVWGASPGAATAMTLMSESYGADIRLVAFMQYMRVILVALAATIVARIWMAPAADALPAIVWFPSVAWPNFALTALLIVVCAAAGSRLPIPAGPLLAPIAIGALLQNAGVMRTRAAALAARGGLSHRRLEYRAPVQSADPDPRRESCAAAHRVHPVSSRPLCRPCRSASEIRARRSADGLSGDQPRRRRLGRDHRSLFPCGHAVRHGHADRPICHRPVDRSGDCAIRHSPYPVQDRAQDGRNEPRTLTKARLRPPTSSAPLRSSGSRGFRPVACRSP